VSTTVVRSAVVHEIEEVQLEAPAEMVQLGVLVKEPDAGNASSSHVLPFHDVPATHDAVPVFVSSVVPLCTDVNVLEAPDPYERVLDTPPLVFAVENCVPFCRVDRVVVKLADTHDTDVVQEEAPLAIVQLGTVSVDVAAGVQVG
jgi:hypothetical protein